MKKTISILVLLFCALSFITCDKKITRAIPAVSSCDFKDLSLIVVKTNAAATNLNVKKVLLEDYTGQWCGNCPKAARKAEQLQTQYGYRLVVMANHVTVQYAAPISGDTLYQTDYRNEASTAWDNRLKISTTPGLPGGAVDRTIPYAVPIADFSSRVAAQMEVAAGARLEVTTYYDSLKYILKAKVKTTFLQGFTDNINLVVAVTQDSIIGTQKDYAPPPGDTLLYEGDARPNYVFDNMVLGSLNGDVGQLVKTAPSKNDTVTLTTPCFYVNRCFWQRPNGSCKNKIIPRYVNVVAFVYNATTQEVLQVEKIRIQ